MMDSILPAAMAERKIPGAVVVVVQGGRVVMARGYGFADVARGRPWHPDTTVFPIASISKVFTATAVVQLADRGQLRLDEDVNRYLRRLQVPPSFGAPVTPLHLLTHSAGFDELPGRTLVGDTGYVQPLHRFLRNRLVRVRAPGELTSYSSYGAALAGLLVEEVSGLEYERYLSCGIWGPLGMARTQVTIPEWLRADLAVPYEVKEGNSVPVQRERSHTAPASSISSTATDMARYMIALLNGGRLGDVRILSDTAAQAMLTQHARVHPDIPGWGLGVQLSNVYGQRIAEHGGDIAGFHSMMVLLPDHETGLFIAGHHEGSDLRRVVRGAFLRRWFPDTRQIVPPQADPAAVARLRRLEGTYRGTIRCYTCPEGTSFPVPEVQVTVRDDGVLMFGGAEWIETAPLLFHHATYPRNNHLGFTLHPDGRVFLAISAVDVLEKVP